MQMQHDTPCLSLINIVQRRGIKKHLQFLAKNAEQLRYAGLQGLQLLVVNVMGPPETFFDLLFNFLDNSLSFATPVIVSNMVGRTSVPRNNC